MLSSCGTFSRVSTSETSMNFCETTQRSFLVGGHRFFSAGCVPFESAFEKNFRKFSFNY